MNQSSGLVIISKECPNCIRLLDVLKRIPDHGLIVVEYHGLTPMQRVGLTAVPTLIQNNGKRVVGTAVFEYINEKYYQRMIVDGFEFNNELLFSNIGDPAGFGESDTGYATL
jgi:hypothetical protein